MDKSSFGSPSPRIDSERNGVTMVLSNVGDADGNGGPSIEYWTKLENGGPKTTDYRPGNGQVDSFDPTGSFKSSAPNSPMTVPQELRIQPFQDVKEARSQNALKKSSVASQFDAVAWIYSTYNKLSYFECHFLYFVFISIIGTCFVISYKNLLYLKLFRQIGGVTLYLNEGGRWSITNSIFMAVSAVSETGLPSINVANMKISSQVTLNFYDYVNVEYPIAHFWYALGSYPGRFNPPHSLSWGLIIRLDPALHSAATLRRGDQALY